MHKASTNAQKKSQKKAQFVAREFPGIFREIPSSADAELVLQNNGNTADGYCIGLSGPAFRNISIKKLLNNIHSIPSLEHLVIRQHYRGIASSTFATFSCPPKVPSERLKPMGRF
jgi:hypothetical protein